WPISARPIRARGIPSARLPRRTPGLAATEWHGWNRQKSRGRRAQARRSAVRDPHTRTPDGRCTPGSRARRENIHSGRSWPFVGEMRMRRKSTPCACLLKTYREQREERRPSCETSAGILAWSSASSDLARTSDAGRRTGGTQGAAAICGRRTAASLPAAFPLDRQGSVTYDTERYGWHK